jgi:ubiquinone/menaquinone biosynthesis C-methylase UbiE
MKFKTDFFRNFLKEAPLPLAIERSLECQILSNQEFKHPILDIGCGDGIFASILFDEKIDVGIDPNELELQQAEKYDIYVNLIKCFGNEIPKPSNSFNTIFSNSVLEHIPDIESVLKEAHRLLSKEGCFYITVPTNFFDKNTVVNKTLMGIGLKNTAAKYRVFFNRFWRHYHYYDASTWHKLFEKNGFKAVETIEYGNKRTCLIDDILGPFSILQFINKKIANRWILIPFIRRIQSAIIFPMYKNVVLNDAKKPNECGLIFFKIMRAD